MSTTRNNFILILVVIFAGVLIFFMLRLQNIIMSTQQATAQNATSASRLVQQPVVVTVAPATAIEAPTSEPTALAAPIAATENTTVDNAATGPQANSEYQIYGSTIVGAIHVGAVDDRGFNQANDEGLRQMIAQLPNVRLISAENIPETDEVIPVIDDMVERGAKIIFTQSFGYLPYALEATKRHPDVIFMNAGGFELNDHVGTYLANHVETMYLTGMAAGAVTKSNQLGFISAFPMPSSLASVNAFHLGARAVNPNVTTRIINNGAWVDPEKEREATETLAAIGVDVVAMIVDSPITIVETAQDHNMYVIGFHSGSLQELAPEQWLTGVEHTWGNFFTDVVERVRSGRWQSGHVRGGIESDMFRLAPFGPAVSEEMQGRIEQARRNIIGGRLNIFAGPIVDNMGMVRVPAGAVGDVTLLDNTDWLIEGVSELDVTAVAIEPPAEVISQADVGSEANPDATDTDLIFGTSNHHTECYFFTEITAELLRNKYALTIDLVDFATDDDMYQAMADRQTKRIIDLTLCYGDPADRPFLSKHHGFVANVGDAYWQGPEYRLQILSNSTFAAETNQTNHCVYQFLRTIHFEEIDTLTQTPAEWIANNPQQVDALTNCN